MSRGKEYKGQTLVVDGSKSGASVVITRLSYDSAFNLEFIGEARYGSKESDFYWYIERLSYDSAFNLTSIQTAQNERIIASSEVTPQNNTIRINSTTVFIDDLRPGTEVIERREDTAGNITTFSYTIVSASPLIFNDVIFAYSVVFNSGASPQETSGSSYTVQLEDYSLKDFNKRAWDARALYTYE